MLTVLKMDVEDRHVVSSLKVVEKVIIVSVCSLSFFVANFINTRKQRQQKDGG
jgi:hypothetical protein